MKILRFLCCLSLVLGCEIYKPSDLLDGCDSENFIAIVNPTTGFVISEENCGLEVDKTTFYEQPYVFYTEAFDNMKYTLVMVDNDNPLAVDGNMYLHWLATDIDGQSLRHGLGIHDGNTVAAYVNPDPSQETCVHRYSIYIYEQRFHSLGFSELPEYRSDFNLSRFIESITPEGCLCGPDASIEFKSRY